MKKFKHKALASSIAMAISGTAYANLNNGLVLHLEFEGNAQDSSSYGNHGIENGVEYVTGMRGQAVSFNGNGAFIKVPDTDSLDTDYVMTIATWINPNSATDPNRITGTFVSKWYTVDAVTHEGDWVLNWSGKTDESVKFYVANYPELGTDNGSLAVTGGIVPKDSWQHVTVIFDNGQITTYLNGVLVHEETSVIKSTATNEYLHDDIWFGQTWLGSYAYKGLVDDFRLYSRVLPESEILALYDPSSTPTKTYEDGWEEGIAKCQDDPASCGITATCPHVDTHALFSPSDGILTIPAVDVPDAFGDITTYWAELSLMQGKGLLFSVINVKPILSENPPSYSDR